MIILIIVLIIKRIINNYDNVATGNTYNYYYQ